ncbi:hypothetical protein [Ferroplasma sp.]|uniref:hypothetical protein n=1 Tax=Ferroplasma sp. TaxID=2591003 RepID=UPI00307CE216
MIGLNLSNTFIAVALILIVIRIMYKRLKRGLKGQQFKTSRLLRTPVIYLFLLIFFMLAFIGNIDYMAIILAICILGIIPGLAFGERVTFFDSDGKIFYKRSPYLLSIWAVAFIIRISFEFIYPNNLSIQFIIDALLAVTLGLIIGESLRAYRKYKQYIEERNSFIY